MPLSVCDTPVAMPTPSAVRATAAQPQRGSVASARTASVFFIAWFFLGGTSAEAADRRAQVARRRDASPVHAFSAHLQHAAERDRPAAARLYLAAHQRSVKLLVNGPRDARGHERIAREHERQLHVVPRHLARRRIEG